MTCDLQRSVDVHWDILVIKKNSRMFLRRETFSAGEMYNPSIRRDTGTEVIYFLKSVKIYTVLVPGQGQYVNSALLNCKPDPNCNLNLPGMLLWAILH